MRIIYIMLLFNLFSCKQENKLNYENKILFKGGSIIYFTNKEDSSVHVDIKNWQDSLPDSVYNINVVSMAILDSSNVKLRKSLLQKVLSIGIYDSRLGDDTLYLDRSFKSLNHLSLINPKCVIVNLDSITIKKLDYFSREDRKFDFALNLNKINGLDTIKIDAPTEYIKIPTNKSYKRITICTKNNQIENLKKYYDNVFVWISCE